MSKQLLDNLFAGDKTRQFRAQVVIRQGAGRWTVKDDDGRETTVTSDQEWKPVLDWVTVQADSIVGRASAAKSINVYEVR